MKVYADELIEEAIRYYITHTESIVKVADKFNMDNFSLNYHLRKRGLVQRGNGGGKVVQDAMQMFEDTDMTIAEVAKVFNMSKDSLYSYLRRAGRYENRTGLKYNREYFDSIDTEDKAYWLGFIAADGNVRSKEYGHDKDVLTIALQRSDKGHLNKFAECIGYSGDIKDIDDNRYPTSRIALASQDIVRTLIAYGIVPAKSSILEYPTVIQGTELERHFIRGFLDGNGCIRTYRDNKLNICVVGTEGIISGIASYFNRMFGIRPKYYANSGTTFLREYRKVYSDADKIAEHLYGDCSMYLDRKKQVYMDYCRSCEESNAIAHGNNDPSKNLEG